MGNRVDTPQLTSTLTVQPDECEVREVLRTPRLTVEAHTPLTPAEARTLVKRVDAALAWGDAVQQWEDDQRWRGRLRAVLLSDRCLTRETGAPATAVPGATTGPDEILLRRRSLSRPGPGDAETLAHELMHVQDWRMAGRAEVQVPLYLQEGKAYVLGLRYGADPRRLREVGADLAQLTGDSASWVVNQFRREHPQGQPGLSYLGEVGGALFVEYLRVHVAPDAIVRLADALEAAGRGTRFERTFQTALGLSLRRAEEQFVDWVRSTEGDPGARLRGTVFEDS